MPLREDVLQAVWPQCEDAFARRGFVHEGAGHFIRSLPDGISHGITVHVEPKGPTVTVEAYVMIFHSRAMAVVDAGFKAMRIGAEDYASMAIDIRSLASALRRAGHSRSLLVSKPVIDVATARNVVASVIEGVGLLADRYFSKGISDLSLIDYFESDPSAGGTANKLKLLSLYYVARQITKLENVLASISLENSSPMTIDFKDYILTRLSEERAQIPR